MIATYWLTEVGQHMPVDIGILRKSGQIEKLPATCSNVDRSPKANSCEGGYTSADLASTSLANALCPT